MTFDFDKLLSVYNKEISKNTKNKKKIYNYDLYKFENLYKLITCCTNILCYNIINIMNKHPLNINRI